jgi:probable rRNA maturation factor
MTVEVTNRSGVVAPEREIESLLTFGISYMDLHSDCEISVTFVDDKEMEELHIKWMDEPGTTDVLSFPMDMPEGKNDPQMLGDIVIDPLVAANQAATAGHSTEHEIFILAAHGLLHILGYDHADKDEEKFMFDLQETIVKKWEAKNWTSK